MDEQEDEAKVIVRESTKGIFRGHEATQVAPVFEGMVQALSSRRAVIGSGLGALLGATFGLQATRLIEPANAAPSDVIGSPNVAVKAFRNEDGYFVLYSDGSIVDSEGTRTPGEPSQWPFASGFKRPQAVSGRPSGSPFIAVDVVQDKNGTHVLFADGSVRTPNADGVKSKPLPQLYYYTFFWQQIGGTGIWYDELEKNGNRFNFKRPFLETPLFWTLRRSSGDWGFFHNDLPGGYPVDKDGFMAALAPGVNEASVFIGKV